MPRGDRTGPAGNGPMTGRQMGYCAGNNQPGYTTGFGNFGRGFGRDFRRGFGYGRGFGNRRGFGFANGNFYDASTPNVSEKTMLENEVNSIKDQLSFLEKRLSEISNKDKES